MNPKYINSVGNTEDEARKNAVEFLKLNGFGDLVSNIEVVSNDDPAIVRFLSRCMIPGERVPEGFVWKYP